MRIREMQLLGLLMFALAVGVGRTAPSLADESTGVASAPVMLVVVASLDGGVNEFLVLRQAGHNIQWNAAPVPPTHGPQSGGVDGHEGQLAAVFERVKKLDDRGGRKPGAGHAQSVGPIPGANPQANDAVRTGLAKGSGARHYSLLLVDANGARACNDLSPGQENEVRAALRNVFDDVLNKGPFAAKRHTILDLLYRDDDAREISFPKH